MENGSLRLIAKRLRVDFLPFLSNKITLPSKGRTERSKTASLGTGLPAPENELLTMLERRPVQCAR